MDHGRDAALENGGRSLGRDLNPGSRPYQDSDTFRVLNRPFCPSSDNGYYTGLLRSGAVLEFPVFPAASLALRHCSVIAHSLETPGKQAVGLRDSTTKYLKASDQRQTGQLEFSSVPCSTAYSNAHFEQTIFSVSTFN